MRLMVMVLGAVLVLAGCGAGAYFYFVQPAEASAPEGEEHVQEAKKKKEGGHGGGFEYVELDPLVLPIVDKNGVSQVVSMVIALEVDGASTATEVKNLSPRLKDAYIQDLYGMLNEHAALKGGVIQVSYIKSRLNKISHKVLGEDKVHDVLLQVVQQRPI